MPADLLIIGSGIAGMYAALQARELGLSVAVVSKTALTGGNTFWAQGGIAAPLEAQDNAAHRRDTLEAARGLADPAAVDAFVQEAQGHLDRLTALGVPFAADLALEGGHSKPRVRHAWGDATGRAISVTLAERVRASGAALYEHAFVSELLQAASGRVVGAGLLGGDRLEAGAVLLATGGFGRAYSVCTAPPEATGDGLALAYRAGAALRDLEFVQFHPTVFQAGGEGCLITEAARGEGAYLLDAHGERFMPALDPQAELAPRDVVARAVQQAREQTGAAYLDLRHLGANFAQERFPSIQQRLQEHGLDLGRDLIPVWPAAHYTIGGVQTDLHGRSTVPGLYAAGEVASSGLHGANRLASNSLSEGLVFGDRAVRAAAGELQREAAQTTAPGEALDPAGLRTVRERLARHAGLIRSEAGLKAALTGLPDAAPARSDQAALEAGNLRLIAGLLLRHALERQESRGCHWREDYPGLSTPYHVVSERGQTRRVPLPMEKETHADAR